MDRTLQRWKLILIGLVGGVFGGGLGLGGGFIMVPLFVWFGFGRHRAHATSLAAIMMVSLVGATSFGLSHELDLGTGVLIGLGGIVGSMFGAQVMHISSPRTLRLVFGLAMILVAVRLLLGGTPETGPVDFSPALHVAVGLVIGAVAGFLAGVAGIGGGIVIVPASIFLLGLGQHAAQGTSLAAIVFTSMAGTLVNLKNRRVLIQEGLIVGVGGAAGSVLGTRSALALTDRNLAAVFGLAVLVIALNTVWDSIRDGRRVGASLPTTGD